MNSNEFGAALEECRIADEDLFVINRKELNAMISKSKLEQICTGNNVLLSAANYIQKLGENDKISLEFEVVSKSHSDFSTLKETDFKNIQFELNRCDFDKSNIKKEDDNMYTSLEITFKSGETITYKEGEWDDYSYDRKAIIVKKKGTWVGIYNFDNVFCVELKKK